MPSRTNSSERVIKVFKTEQGYLHDEVSEGWWLEDGVRNYDFTDDVFVAYEFYNDDDNDDVPKYIGVTHEEDVYTREQMCEVLKGRFVVVKFKTTTTTEWEETEE